MARADLLVSLVRSGSAGDRVGFRRTAEAIIAEEHAKQHGVLASQLSEALKEEQPRRIGPATDVGSSLVFEIEPRRRLDELVLPDSIREAVAAGSSTVRYSSVAVVSVGARRLAATPVFFSKPSRR